MNNHSPFVLEFVRVVGSLTANTVGRLDRYTKEHRDFLSSGFECSVCHQRLIGKWLIADVTCYDSQGGRIPLMKERLKGQCFECPRCLHRWPMREGNRVAPKSAEPSAAPEWRPHHAAWRFGRDGEAAIGELTRSATSMHTEPQDSLILPRKVGDRFLLFVFASVLAGFFALMSFALRER